MKFRICGIDNDGERKNVVIEIFTMPEFQAAINALAQFHFLITKIERLNDNA